MHKLPGKCSLFHIWMQNSLEIPAFPALHGELLVKSSNFYEIPGEILRNSELELDTVTWCRPNFQRNSKCNSYGADGKGPWEVACLRPLELCCAQAASSETLPGQAVLYFGPSIPLGPKLLHYITLLLRINFPDYVIILYITELVSNYFLGYVICCVVTKHTMWALDYIT